VILGGAWYCPLFSIDVKGGEDRGRIRIFPSMTKGEIVGTIVIDGKA
jgi:hypothetical protein